MNYIPYAPLDYYYSSGNNFTITTFAWSQGKVNICPSIEYSVTDFSTNGPFDTSIFNLFANKFTVMTSDPNKADTYTFNVTGFTRKNGVIYKSVTASLTVNIINNC